MSEQEAIARERERCARIVECYSTQVFDRTTRALLNRVLNDIRTGRQESAASDESEDK